MAEYDSDKALRDAIGELKKLRQELAKTKPDARQALIYRRVSYTLGCISQVTSAYGIRWTEF